MDNYLYKLSKSKFRNSFHLSNKDKMYVKEKGLDKIREHAYDFVNKRLKNKLVNDGKQTPYKGHPVFIAQHATACCCRTCLNKWYNFDSNLELSDKQIDFIVELIIKWIEKEMQ